MTDRGGKNCFLIFKKVFALTKKTYKKTPFETEFFLLSVVHLSFICGFCGKHKDREQ